MGNTAENENVQSKTKSATVVKLTKKGLIEDKKQGLAVKDMAKKYTLSLPMMRKALKIAGVEQRASRGNTFEIVED